MKMPGQNWAGKACLMQVSIGIGLTNDCNLACAHCYRPQDQVYQLDLHDVQAITETLEVTSFNMGTGESWLHPQFPAIVAYLAERGIKMSMASNGYSLNDMPASLLRHFHDVEVSVDFATPQQQDAFRGEGNWACVMAAIDRCHDNGIEVTILATLMNTNYDQMDGLVAVARDVGANLRVNVYQPVQQDAFMLSYEQFWEAFRRLFEAGHLLSSSEPIVNAMLALLAGGRASVSRPGATSRPASTGRSPTCPWPISMAGRRRAS
jgi:MoaA/NifB/PqqE/SkfB family radical SAM enzyme